ncbi:PapI protein [Escherichia coli O121:H19]|nr:PapI protein [Escherichia coli O121:H19]AWJ28466.1 PapI protein [Escherichia coli O121 str. RM8352]OTD15317.1 PapI protein [Escherichia coli]QCH71243.1 PapI protein [Escherichia coli O121:H19]
MLPSETMIWQPEFTDKTLSRKPGAVHRASLRNSGECCLRGFLLVDTVFVM